MKKNLAILAVCAMAQAAFPASQDARPVPQQSFASNCAERVTAVEDAICSVTGVSVVDGSDVVQVDFSLVPEPGCDIRCRVELTPPERWDGRFWGVGNSGLGGRLPKLNPYRDMNTAAATTDLGTCAAVRQVKNSRAWSLAVQRDYSWRATHLMTVYAKRIVQACYGKSPSRSYFNGGSCGGRQAFSEAIRFPDEYDGIVAHLPAHNSVVGRFNKWHLWRQTHDENERCVFTKEEMRVVADSAVEHFAATDPKPYSGRFLADGRVSENDLAAILALAAKKMPSLLEGDKMARLKALHSPFYGGGECLTLGFAPGTYLGDKMVNVPAEKTWQEIREFASGDGQWYNANSADLSRFFKRGGKMMVTTGWEDQTIPPMPIVEQYERICAHEGGLENAMRHCRLFCVPGAAHGGGEGRATQGEIGSAFARNALIEWVESGRAPDRIEAPDRPMKNTFPVATYPGLFIKDDAGEWKRIELPRSKIQLSEFAFACDPSPEGMLSEVSLGGVWHVEGDGFKGEAKLPGTLAAAHLGKRWSEHDFQTTMDLEQSEALVQEWQYEGKAVWTRTFELSAADCRLPLELFLERVMWRSEVFWDGVPLGACDSLATPHVYAVPPEILKPGRHELKLVIDNLCRYNFSRSAHSYGPSMQAVWNGVLGRIELRRAHPLRATRVFASAPSGGRLVLETGADVAAVEVEGLRTSGWKAADGRIEVSLAEEPVWWNEFHPRLYSVRLTAKDGFTHRIRFGFRSVGTSGHQLTLNGIKIFERGNVENANFAKDGIPWMDVAEWRKMLKTIKDEDGINAVRFHTWCPPEAAFSAADELGILLKPEAGIWTDRWMTRADEVGNGKPVDGFVLREMKAIADAYGNSPSFFSLSIGNELGTSNFETMGKWVAEHRKYDPRALCYASSARKLTDADDFSLSHVVPGKGLAREKLLPHTDWDYEDIYSAARIPTVAHEIGQWPVYPIWDELFAPFTGTMRPWNLTRHRDTAAKKNALRFQREYHAASARLNRLIYKEEVESFLRTPSCAGLQLLEIQDYTGQAEALVGWRDPFYALKTGFRDMPRFSTVWGPVCYLARFPRFTYVVGETYRAELEIRNLTEKPLAAGTEFPCEIAGRKKSVSLPESIAPGEVKRVGTVELLLTEDMEKRRQTLRFGSNEWNFWVYPKEEKCAVPAGVVETGDLAEMKAAIAEGRTVLYSGPSFKSAKGQFKSVYWSARWFPVANTTAAALGTWFDVKHPALSGFVTDSFTDWQWYSLAQGGVVHALKAMPDAFRPIGLSVNDFHFSDFTATMFEVLVGSGRLFVCGYDLNADTPEARRLRASICAYLAGAPAEGTVKMPERWLADEFDAEKAPDLSGAVYDISTNWTGRVFKMDIKGVPPTTGNVRVDFHQPQKGLTSGRGLLEGRVFEVPFTEKVDAKTHVMLPVIREDFLDGRLELEINVMTGPALAIDRIRIIPQN